MSRFVLLDESNIVRDKANIVENLSSVKLALYGKPIEIDDSINIRYGDEYNPKTGEITPRPENYPQKVVDETEQKIQAEIRSLAITSLKNKGELSKDYKG